MSSGLAVLSTKVSQLHRYLNVHTATPVDAEVSLPRNDTLYETMAAGIAKAWRLYGVKEAIVVFLVQPKESNRFDQRPLEYILTMSYVLNVLHTQ